MTLAVKYRPQSFQDVCGQDTAIKIINNSLKRYGNKIYLISGTRGSGKTTIARLISGSLGISSYDSLEIDGATFNKKDDVDSIIIPFISTYPKGSHKILILDECHMLSKSAWSAMLKPLEELSETVIICLCTTDINKIMPTILSRCIDIRLPNIPVKDISMRLKHIATAENILVQDNALDLVASISDGSMREAISLLESCLLFSSESEITVDTVWSCLNIVSDEQRSEFIKAIDMQDIVKVGEILDSISDYLYFFEMLISFVTREIISVAKGSSIYFNEKNISFLQTLLKKMLNLQLRFAGSDISLNTMIKAFFIAYIKQDKEILSGEDMSLNIQKVLDVCGFIRVW